MPNNKKSHSEEVKDESRRKKSSSQEEAKLMEAPDGEMAPLSPVTGDPVALLMRPEMAHPANAPLRAQAVTELQRQRGNIYVQRLIRSGAIQARLIVNPPDDEYEREADRVAEEVVRMPEPQVQRQPEEEEEEEEFIQTKPLAEQITPLVQRQVEEEEEELLQAKEGAGQTPEVTPELESRIQSLKGGGQPLPESVRAFFEPRFGYDFGQVRVHTDSKAVEAARSVNAKAFTTGRNTILGGGQYSPETPTGKRLLAHELTHVVHQTGGGAIQQKQRNRVSVLQRQKNTAKYTLETPALKIIKAAQDGKIPIDKRAKNTVWNIIKTYYPLGVSLVKKVVYSASQSGLSTACATFKDAKGTITVGNYFVSHTTRKGFARRVLQVDHELEHIRQQRRGMGGPHRAHLREFLAFTREALSPEVPGTGRVSHSMRVRLIDAALKHYYCLTKTLRAKYGKKKDSLLKARSLHQKRSGRKPTPAPTTCPNP